MRTRKSLILALILSLGVGSLFTSSLSISAKTSTPAQKNVCVVLDPGHDSTHKGCHVDDMEEYAINQTIAMYCLQELKTYEGIDVYLTHNTVDCQYGADPNSSSSCLSGRTDFAKEINADLFVSLHNDYDGNDDPTTNGCKVIFQNPSYRKDLCLQSYNVAKSIVEELQKTGLKIDNWKMDPNGTGCVIRNSATSSTYPDFSIMDYYAILKYAKQNGMPAVIVEHAYLSNPSDRENHLSTSDQLKALGEADATAIAKYYGLKKACTN